MIEKTALLRWIPLLPLTGTIVGVAVAGTDRPRIARFVGPSMVLLAFVLARQRVPSPPGLVATLVHAAVGSLRASAANPTAVAR
jgi:hypothetical protein